MNPRVRLFPPHYASTEKREVVRSRVFNVRSRDDIAELVDRLMAEKFSGRMVVNFATGGVPQSIEAEERSRINS